VADGDRSTCSFAEFSSRWRTGFSHLRGGSENQTVMQNVLQLLSRQAATASRSPTSDPATEGRSIGTGRGGVAPRFVTVTLSGAGGTRR
jgi:hypothetical protein